MITPGRARSSRKRAVGRTVMGALLLDAGCRRASWASHRYGSASRRSGKRAVTRADGAVVRVARGAYTWRDVRRAAAPRAARGGCSDARGPRRGGGRARASATIDRGGSPRRTARMEKQDSEQGSRLSRRRFMVATAATAVAGLPAFLRAQPAPVKVRS